MTTKALFLGVALLGIGIGGCSSSSPATSEDAGGTDTGTGQGVDSGTGGEQDSSTGGNDSGGGGVDSSTSTELDSGVTDTGTGTPSWVDMDFADGAANGHACDNNPGVPCGWSATNGGAGYTCRCVFPADQDPWGCSAPDSGAPVTCPAP